MARPVCIRLNHQAILIVSVRYQDTITLKLIRFNLMQVANMFLNDAPQGQLVDTTILSAAHQRLANSMTLFDAHQVWPLI